MMAKNNKIDIKLKLNSIKELKFSSDLDEITGSLIDHEVGFGFNASANQEDKTLTISVGIVLRFQQKILLESWYSFEFIVQKFDEVIEITGDEITCKGELLPSLLGISFSTFRGILYTKTLGTKISPFILPVINPQELIDKRIEKSQK